MAGLKPQHLLLFTALVVLAASLGVGALYLRSVAGSSSTDLPSIDPLTLSSGPAPGSPSGTVDDPQRLEPLRGPGTVQPGIVASTVAWPVVVDLRLVEADYLPATESLKPLGSGRMSALEGRIMIGNRGVPAEVVFKAGLNTGRILQADSEGRLGATDLHPGLQIVDVRGPGISGSTRHLRLRPRVTTPLNITYGMTASVVGTVYDQANEPLEGVTVKMDGQSTLTDSNGDFLFQAMTPGVDLVVVLRKEGYASYMEQSGMAGHSGTRVGMGSVVPKGYLKYRMQKASSLDVVLAGRVGGSGEAIVMLMPEDPKSPHSYPWHLASPARVRPGGRVSFDDLPPGKLIVRAFHEGAVAEPQGSAVTLQSGKTRTLVVEMKPCPRVHGKVTFQGVKATGARVVLEAPDQTAATLQYFKSMPGFLEAMPIPVLPPAYQETRTDSRGEFLLSLWPQYAKGRYLQVTSREGHGWAGLVVRPGDTDIEVQLEPIERRKGALLLDFAGRTQGLPVRLMVGGQPTMDAVLPTGEDLRIADLDQGSWSLQLSWNGHRFYERPEVVRLQDDETRHRVLLPPGAIHGQDEDTVRRAHGIFD